MSRASSVTALGRAQAVLKALFHWMPLIFGMLFIAPLIAQALEYWQVAAPLGLRPIQFGLAIGAPWGLYAVLVGRWL